FLFCNFHHKRKLFMLLICGEKDGLKLKWALNWTEEHHSDLAFQFGPLLFEIRDSSGGILIGFPRKTEDGEWNVWVGLLHDMPIPWDVHIISGKEDRTVC